MKYLDEQINFHFTGIGLIPGETYTYTLSAKYDVDDVDWTLVFIGTYYQVQQSSIGYDIDCTDIIRSYKWDSKRAFSIPYNSSKGLGAPLINKFKLDITIGERVESIEETIAMIYRYPHISSRVNTQLFDIFNLPTTGYYYYEMMQGIYSDAEKGDLLYLTPEVPFKLTDNYGLGIIMESSDIKIAYLQLKKGDSILKRLQSVYNQGITYNSYRLSELFSNLNDVPEYGELSIGGGKTVLLKINKECPHQGVLRNINNYLEVDEVLPEGIDIEYDDFSFTATKEDGGTNIINGKVTFYYEDYTQDDIPFDINEDSFTYTLTVGSKAITGFNFQINGENDTDCYVYYTQEYPFAEGEKCKISFNISGEQRNESVTISNITVEAGDDSLNTVNLKPSKYYLQWQDRFGGFQSQPFNGKCKYKEGFERLDIENYKGNKRPINITVSPTWELNTSWVDANLYPFYESIFVSPYLLLYDVEEDTAYNVVVTNKDYNEELWKNNKKMYNLTLTFELDKTQKIIY